MAAGEKRKSSSHQLPRISSEEVEGGDSGEAQVEWPADFAFSSQKRKKKKAKKLEPTEATLSEEDVKDKKSPQLEVLEHTPTDKVENQREQNKKKSRQERLSEALDMEEISIIAREQMGGLKSKENQDPRVEKETKKKRKKTDRDYKHPDAKNVHEKGEERKSIENEEAKEIRRLLEGNTQEEEKKDKVKQEKKDRGRKENKVVEVKEVDGGEEAKKKNKKKKTRNKDKPLHADASARDDTDTGAGVDRYQNAILEADKAFKKSKSSLKIADGESESYGAREHIYHPTPTQDISERAKKHSSNSEVEMCIKTSKVEHLKDRENKRKRKRVTFQDQIIKERQEHVRDTSSAQPGSSADDKEVEEIWGKRFTAEEDEILKEAVWSYIKSKGWDEQEGLDKVFNSQKHKDAHDCWADIKMSLPHRPRQAIRYRAHLLLEGGAHSGKWSLDEEELLKQLQEQHGNKWKEISNLFEARHRTSLKEKWRSLKRALKGSRPRGVWTQEELQRLSDMVHECLRLKVTQVKGPDRHLLRDDINWDKIADTIGTHNHGACCMLWYRTLQSSMVSDGLWANEDDYFLLKSLLESGACTEEEVEWDNLLDQRSGHACSTRWKQMVKHLGENRTRQFLDKLDVLVRRYAPNLLEAFDEGETQ